MTSLPTVRCLNCDLMQFPGKVCRRCRKAMLAPKPPVDTQKIPTSEIVFPWPTDLPLPTMKQVHTALIVAALNRAAGNREQAAKMLGIGKTTMYRTAPIGSAR
jgi:transcriptional regulator of acetoin/glycerol metabolism